MSEETVAPVEATVEVNPENLTDEQMDQYFDTQGESLETPEPSSEKKEVVESQSDEEDGRSSVDKPNPNDDRKVPLAALHQERQRRQEQDRKLAILEDRLSRLQEGLTPKEQEEVLDVNENPIEYFQRENQKLKEQLEEINSFREQSVQQTQQHQQMQQFKTAYASAAQEYAKQQTDFSDAYKFVVESRMTELQTLGYDQQQAAIIAQNDEAAFVSKAFQDGVNPAERVYQLALTRGYKKQGNTQKPDVDLETIEKGVKDSKSVNAMAGSPSKPMTLESLAEMDDEEFEKNFYKILKQS
jgi:hypothetical protein